MLRIDSRKIIADANAEKLSQFFMDHSEQIYSLIRERLQQEPQTPYNHFIAEHPDGQQRSRAFLKAFQEALHGNVDILFDDQRRIGYKRAVEGYQLEDLFAYKTAFTDVMWFLIDNHNTSRKDTDDRITLNDIKVIHHLTDHSNFLLSDSFLRTRDEIIQHRRNQLQQLHHYAAKAISIFDREVLKTCASQEISTIFGLNGSYMALCRRNGPHKRQPDNMVLLSGLIGRMEERVMETSEAMSIDENGNLIAFDEEMPQEEFQGICVPIHTANLDMSGLFVIHDQGRVFKFQRFDKNLLYQFAYFTGAILSNSVMVSELARKKEELHELTGKLISVQEEEKKRLGADIHDTITQTLTAIGYKALVCQALIVKDLPRLEKELNGLVHDINGALKKSRSIISELRPKILDDLGIVAALQQAIDNFKEDSGLAVLFDCPKTMNINPDAGIALYRIVQEALRNIHKHAGASQVAISLVVEEENQLSLNVEDNGRGMAANPPPQTDSHSGMGLLTMRERAEDLGGRFAIESKHGDGCRLTVTVPL